MGTHMIYYIYRKEVTDVDMIKDLLAIAKDLIQIIVLVLTVWKLTKKDEEK